MANTPDSTFLDLGRPVSPNPFRHQRTFSDASIFSVSSYASDLNLSVPPTVLSRTNSNSKPPKQRLTKLIKSSLKHTLKSNNADASNIDFWKTYSKKLRKIIRAFNDPLALYDALNDPYSGKSSTKTCSSLIHILCKQFYLYSRSNNWSVCFKIWDCIVYILENGGNPSIFYTKLNEAPQKNYNSIHTLYEGLRIMLESEVINHEQFTTYFSRAISAGNEESHIEFVNNLNETSSITSESLTSLPSISTTSSNTNIDDDDHKDGQQHKVGTFNPAVLTLCVYKQSMDDDPDDIGWEWQNITYWTGDCCFNDYYVYLISPHLAKGMIMMGYDLLNIVDQKLGHLDYNIEEKVDLMISDPLRIREIINDGDKINDKVIAFLWFIRFGNFKSDLINILDIGIKQLALNEFVVKQGIIEEILSYSHYHIMSNIDERDGNPQHGSMDKLKLAYFDEDKWMMTAFEILFKLNNTWIDWIGEFVMPQLTDIQTKKIKQNLSNNVTDKQWNKFIRRISLKSINAFCKHDIFGIIDTNKMQQIIKTNYRDPDLAPIIMNANYDIEQTFGNSSILYKILNDDTMDNIQIDNILNAIHHKINDLKIRPHDLANEESKDNQTLSVKSNNSEKLIINDLLFGTNKQWNINQSIWRNISLVFDAKYKHFQHALYDLFYELTTKQHHKKLTFFIEHDMIDFGYCLKADLIESGLQSLIKESLFKEQVNCIQMIGEWMCKNIENEKDDDHKKQIALKATSAIEAILSSDDSPRSEDRAQDSHSTIIEEYLTQLKTTLSR